MNILPREIDTASYVYDVSYTVGSWQPQSPKAENICVFRKSPLRPEVPANTDLSATAELSRQSGAVTEIVDLPPLPVGGSTALFRAYPKIRHLKEIVL